MEPCTHYDRGCDLLAPCCNEFYPCRFCHDKVKYEEEKDIKKSHKLVRNEVQSVRCRSCQNVQTAIQNCESCGACLGAYFCSTCKLYDNNLEKHIYHCEKCGICRIGPQESFWHCDNCEACLAIATRESHRCRQGVLKANCAICQEDMFTSRTPATELRCGHWIHNKCMKEMYKHGHFACPICNKSTQDLTEYYQEIDKQIEATPMPEEYKNIECNILCNDCLEKSTILFHFYGLKCKECGSYNTSRI
ncbi:unnamed protein product [Blepharisma stoltei]|uniref:Uncharacterized protein n=1 Tax=Blepharisma stoltei TaxID=1481888 RepID=A0AAU9IYZ0_9CILI|nr:unnamed protein product [Blepharisma stoltei]